MNFRLIDRPLWSALASNNSVYLGIARCKFRLFSVFSAYSAVVSYHPDNRGIRGIHRKINCWTAKAVGMPPHSTWVARRYLSAIHDNPYINTPPPGKLYFWRAEIGPMNGVPISQDIIDKLSSDNLVIRWAAQCYMYNLHKIYKTDIMLKETADSNKAAWLCIGILNNSTRCRIFYDQEALDRLKRLGSDEFLLNSDEQLSILTAFMLTRYTKNIHPLEVIATRKYSDATLSNTLGNITYHARYSEPIQNFFRSKTRTGTTLHDKIMTGDSVSTENLTSFHYQSFEQ